MTSLKRLALVLLVTLSAALVVPVISHSADPYPNCRFGLCLVTDIDAYNVAQLNAGWYLDWGTGQTPSRPNGMEYVQVIRVQQTGSDTYSYSPSGATLGNVVAANPGATWFVGNEPDSIWQDDIKPDLYARVYHDVYTLLKGQDPNCKVAIGAIVQPTPLRLQYLDIVWDTYRTLYGEKLPTDLWNIHSFILREKRNPPDNWGAYIPPGIDADEGMLYDMRDIDNLDIFRQRIITFRQWMKDKGERNKPLWISEYGILFPDDYFDEDGRYFDHARVKAFLEGTFDFFLNETDESLGYPYDENRLVQRWAWYSVDDDNLGGYLFDPMTKAIEPLGQDYANYTDNLAAEVDLWPAVVFSAGAFSETGEALTVTVEAVISNIGTISTTEEFVVRFYDDDSGPQIGSDQIISGLDCCAGVASVEVTWPLVPAGAHTVRVRVDPLDAIVEGDESNNEATGIVLVTTERTWIPLITRGWTTN
jgi:hypothetical protein